MYFTERHVQELLVTGVGLILFFGWLLLVFSPIWDMIKNFKFSYSGEKTFFFQYLDKGRLS